MDSSGKQVVMVVPVDGAWVWKFAVGGDHGVVQDGDGRCATREEAVAEGLSRHPDAEVIDVENPAATF